MEIRWQIQQIQSDDESVEYASLVQSDSLTGLGEAMASPPYADEAVAKGDFPAYAAKPLWKSSW